MSLKPYKIDLSGFDLRIGEVVRRAIIEHARCLGYQVTSTSSDVIIVHDIGSVVVYEISASDFLALEPEKVPDFHPFDKILVKDKNDTEWRPAFFWEVAEDGRFREITGDVWDECVSYEGNEGLLG